MKDISKYESMASQLDDEAGSSSHEVESWAEPTPLPSGLPDVPPFDIGLLPTALREWIADIAFRMQCPVDIPAVAAITAISSLIGARAVVAPKKKDDWRVVPNLWGVVVGRPGVMKSPAISEALRPLSRLEQKEREKWLRAYEEWELDTKVAELAAKANERVAGKVAAKNPQKAKELLQSTESLAEPVARRLVINDATVEKLGEILVDHPWGTFCYRDELYGLLCSLDRQGQEGSRAFYLQGYDGNQSYTFDRIIRGTHYIPRVCLSMLGSIQPGKVQSYVRSAVVGGTGDDGLLQRFGLAVWPDIERDFIYVDRWPDKNAKQVAWAVFERLYELKPVSDSEPVEWRFSDSAQVIFQEWLIDFEPEIRGDELHPALISHLSKYRKLVPALALIFAIVDTPENQTVIGEGELNRALGWYDYLRKHAERLYSAALVPETTSAQVLLNKLKSGKLISSEGEYLTFFTPRSIAVKSWAGLSSSDEVRKAADLLVDYGWLELKSTHPSIRGGRPSETYTLHPKILGGRNEVA